MEIKKYLITYHWRGEPSNRKMTKVEQARNIKQARQRASNNSIVIDKVELY